MSYDIGPTTSVPSKKTEIEVCDTTTARSCHVSMLTLMDEEYVEERPLNHTARAPFRLPTIGDV